MLINLWLCVKYSVSKTNFKNVFRLISHLAPDKYELDQPEHNIIVSYIGVLTVLFSCKKCDF